MAAKIKISVIMPIYNAGIYLKTAIESILNQDLRDIELLLVDDGSTDGSSLCCEQYALKDSRVKVIHQTNGGICNARNSGLKISKGEYIAFIDHDDEYLPGYLRHAYDEAKKNNADIVKVGKKEFVISGSKVLRVMKNCTPYQKYDDGQIKASYFSLVDNRTLDCVWDALYRKDLIKKHDLRFDENFKHGGEDIVFNQRLLPYVHSMVCINQCYYFHYIRKGFSTSSTFGSNHLQMQMNKMMVINDTIKKLGIFLDESHFDYTYLLLRQYIVNVCSYYSSKDLEMILSNRKIAISKIREEPFFYDFCDKQSVCRVMIKSFRYGLLYFFFVYRLYSAILFLFKVR